MKKLLHVLFFTAFFVNANAQQWISLNPNPTGVELSAVQMFSNNHGYMVGYAGTLLEFNGTDWQVVAISQLTGDISSMCFLDENNGWVATTGGTIYHFDGTNWTMQFNDPSAYFFSIHFSDNNNGWAVGLNGAVVKFNGTSWVNQEAITETTLWTVYCLDATHVWAAGNQELFFYNGIEWVAELEGAPCAFIDFHFNSPTEGTVYTNQALIYTYNGSEWTEVPLNNGGFEDVDVISSTNIWGVDVYGSIWHSDGTEWVLVEEEIIPNYGGFQGLDFSDATHGWAVGTSGSIYEFDGTEWSRYTEGFTHSLSDMDYADENNVWMVGGEGFIYYNNGAGWEQQTCPLSDVRINNIDVLSQDNVWAIADDFSDYYVLHYDGSAWSTHTTLTQQFVSGLDMISENLGWACSGMGDIIKYDGTNWTTFTNIADAHLFNIYFNSENDGWVGGYCGPKLYHYNGTDWSPNEIAGLNDDFMIKDIKFISPNNGWAVGLERFSWTPSGYILHYDGTNWTVVLEVAESPFSGLEILNDTLCFAVGDQTYKYNGTEWLPFNDNLPNGVEGVCFVNGETGWAYGNDGLFYKYNSFFGVGTNEYSNKIDLNINVVPNPSSKYVSLQIPTTDDNVALEIYNMNGVLVYDEKHSSKTVHVGNLPNGIYCIKATTNGKVYSSKFIKN